MPDRGKGLRLAASLWFAAALVALGSIAYRVSQGAEIRWFIAALGVAGIIMGFNAIQRARKADAEDGGQSPAP